MGSIGSNLQPNQHTLQLTGGRPVGGHAAAQVLAPSTWGTPQVHHALPRTDEMESFVNFFELVRSASAVALFLCQFDVGVVDVLVKPRLVDFFTLGFDFHGRAAEEKWATR